MKEKLRNEMVDRQIIARGIKNERVLNAMKSLDRHIFASGHSEQSAYGDYPLPIGHNQTISQPYIVALMSELCELTGSEKVLEIGTGSAYQTAILSMLAKEVYSIEIVEELALSAKDKIARLGFNNVFLQHGDGYKGWEEKAPFDVIMLTASPPSLPEKIVMQLKDGGLIVAPVGSDRQILLRIQKNGNELIAEEICAVRFVPMVKTS